jgi:cell fate regulator YaaT (PSP1 superfamily)
MEQSNITPADKQSSKPTPSGISNVQSNIRNKLLTYDWLEPYLHHEIDHISKIVEVRFKSTRKAFYKNPKNLNLIINDPVVVETNMGYDIGFISIASDLVYRQMKNKEVDVRNELQSIIRLPTLSDIHTWKEAIAREHQTKLKARQLAKELGLVMKINDIEYQADNKKATFFYTAEGRIDFRELIKVLASTFRIKVEMKQIGIRQESGRVGGIGECGRELCCSTWLTNFNTVPTVAAKQQNLYLNPAKLSGQCGRLKCCLNYELDAYLEAFESFPDENLILQTAKGNAKIFKIDILNKIMWFIIEGQGEILPLALTVESVKKIVELNKKGVKPSLSAHAIPVKTEAPLKSIFTQKPDLY